MYVDVAAKGELKSLSSEVHHYHQEVINQDKNNQCFTNLGKTEGMFSVLNANPAKNNSSLCLPMGEM